MRQCLWNVAKNKSLLAKQHPAGRALPSSLNIDYPQLGVKN